LKDKIENKFKLTKDLKTNKKIASYKIEDQMLNKNKIKGKITLFDLRMQLKKS